MRFVDLFSGIGGFRRGLERCGHVAVGHVEIDRFANESYMAMYELHPCKYEKDVTRNSYRMCHREVSRECKGSNCRGEWYGKDIKQLTAREIPQAEIWTFGFPCTDISISGKRAGLSGERSGLFFEVTRLLEGQSGENKPRWIIVENVKHLLSIERGGAFTTVLSELSKVGYDLQWEVQNSKHFGVPQNRERVYLVGCLRGRGGGEIFPLRRTNQTTIKQVLGGKQGDRIYDPSGLSITITANAGGFGGKTGLYQMPTFIDLNDEPTTTEIARCLTARYRAGTTKHKGVNSGVLVVPKEEHSKQTVSSVRAVLTPEREEKRQNGRRIKEEGEPSFTLTCRDRHGVLICKYCENHKGFPIREAKKDGYTMAYHGDGVNLAYPNSQVSRGRVGKGCAQTLVTGGTMGACIGCRIRRLTPRECFRLQAFEDALFDRAKEAGISDAQLYKQAGNAVTVNVVYEIAVQLGMCDTQEVEDEI